MFPTALLKLLVTTPAAGGYNDPVAEEEEWPGLEAWWSPTQGYIVPSTHPGDERMVRVFDRLVVPVLPADAVRMVPEPAAFPGADTPPPDEPTVTIPRELLAHCDNVTDDFKGGRCPGLLRYRWGQSDAACDTCGARCGIAVATWARVDVVTLTEETR